MLFARLSPPPQPVGNGQGLLRMTHTENFHTEKGGVLHVLQSVGKKGGF